MTDNEQMFRLTEAMGTLNANVQALLIANAEAAKQRDKTVREVQELKSKVEDFASRLVKAEAAADEYDKIKTLGKGYLAGAVVSGAFAGGSIIIWFQDHIKGFIAAFRA
jgi:uncharacterized coiled-coil DUF342 family protein